MARRPAWSGGLITRRRSKRPGRSRAESRISGRLVAPRTMTPSAPVNPSISVRIWLSVCSRSSWPPMLVGAAPGPADGVELVDEDDGRRRLLGLLEQVADPAGPDPDDHLDELRGRHREEGDARLAGQSPGQQGLARPRRPRQQHALGDGGAEAAVPLGVLQEVDDLGDLVFHVVDAGHVLEAHPLALFGFVALRLGAADAADPAGAEAAGHPAGHEQQQPEEQERGTEAEQQPFQERRPGRRLGVHLDAFVGQELEDLVVGEARPVGGEPVDLDAVGSGRVLHLRLEAALDGVFGGGDLRDIARFHLGAEERVGNPRPFGLLGASSRR